MIHLRMSMADLERMRFAYSPMAEVAESLWMLSSGQIRPPHRVWWAMTRDRLGGIDTELLAAVVPARPDLPSFLFAGATEPATTIEAQLSMVAECAPDRLLDDLRNVWRDDPLPPPAEALVAEGSAGARRLADVLWDYWSVAIEPHWRQIRAVLDDDVAYRATRLTSGGIAALFSDLHPEVEVAEQTLRIDTPDHSCVRDLSGQGLVLVPSVFTWPSLIIGTRNPPPSLTYGSRGVGTVWGTPAREPADDDALGALLGRSRAAILSALELPQSTTELALELGQSAPSVSQHLAVLRRSGLLTSWRSGRRVLYQRTPLATSIVAASGSTGTGSENLA